MSGTTPRSKPVARPASPRASPRAAPAAPSPKPAGEPKKVKAKKPKAAPPTAPVSLGVPVNKVDEMSEEQAKTELESLQRKYGALIVNFNNQQAELAASQKRNTVLEEEVLSLKAQMTSPTDEQVTALQEQLRSTLQVRPPRHRSLLSSGRLVDQI